MKQKNNHLNDQDHDDVASAKADSSEQTLESMVEQSEQASKAGRQIARAASVVMLAYVFSTLIGILRGMVVSGAFGTSADLDSFNAANRVTELLFNLTAGGALGSAFIPMFTGMLTKREENKAWRLASGVMNTLVIILIIVAALMWAFAPAIVEKGLFVLTPGTQVTQIELTVRLLRIMLPTVIIFGVSGLIMGILNAHQVFLWPALAPSAYSLGIILGVLLLPKSMGIDRLAYGTLIGAAGHFLLQVPTLFKLPKRAYFIGEGLKNKATRQVFKLMFPRILGASVVQLNFVANTIIGLSLGEGAASAVTWAFTLMLMPQAAIAQSAGTASLPTLSAQYELGQHEQFKQTLTGIIRAVMLLAIPATVGMILLRVPLVQVIYERGQFDATSTAMVSWALLWYVAGLVGHCLVEVLSRGYYAMQDTRTPVIVGVLAMGLNIALSFLFVRLFTYMPHGGLALANSVATALESIVLMVILRKRLDGLGGKNLYSAIWKSLLASAVMGGVIWAWMSLMAGRSKYLVLLGGGVLGLLAYGLMIWLLKVPELRAIFGRIKQRLARAG